MANMKEVAGNRQETRRFIFMNRFLGQASSNDAGCGSAISSTGTAGGLERRSDDKRSGGSGSPDRAWARSRSFRDVDENSKLRFDFKVDGGGSGCIGSGIG